MAIQNLMLKNSLNFFYLPNCFIIIILFKKTLFEFLCCCNKTLLIFFFPLVNLLLANWQIVNKRDQLTCYNIKVYVLN